MYRRTLLRGALLAPAAAALAASPTFARPRGVLDALDVDYPGAHWYPASPSNYTSARRPSDYPVHFVVVHVAQETYDDTIAIFQNPAKQVSAHYVVRSADGQVAQCVRERDIGWHAGNWTYNARSIGIEHEGWVDQPEWFTDAMYASSASLTAAVCAQYGIRVSREWIIGHNEVPGADHTDPGPHWDWDRYMDLVEARYRRLRR